MARVIRKFRAQYDPGTDQNYITIPEDAYVATFMFEGEDLVAWVDCPSDAPEFVRCEFHLIFGEGPIPDGYEALDHLVHPSGAVMHIFGSC